MHCLSHSSCLPKKFNAEKWLNKCQRLREWCSHQYWTKQTKIRENRKFIDKFTFNVHHIIETKLFHRIERVLSDFSILNVCLCIDSKSKQYWFIYTIRSHYPQNSITECIILIYREFHLFLTFDRAFHFSFEISCATDSIECICLLFTYKFVWIYFSGFSFATLHFLLIFILFLFFYYLLICCVFCFHFLFSEFTLFSFCRISVVVQTLFFYPSIVPVVRSDAVFEVLVCVCFQYDSIQTLHKQFLVSFVIWLDLFIILRSIQMVEKGKSFIIMCFYIFFNYLLVFIWIFLIFVSSLLLKNRDSKALYIFIEKLWNFYALGRLNFFCINQF